jgi:hypothetical protein
MIGRRRRIEGGWTEVEEERRRSGFRSHQVEVGCSITTQEAMKRQLIDSGDINKLAIPTGGKAEQLYGKLSSCMSSPEWQVARLEEDEVALKLVVIGQQALVWLGLKELYLAFAHTGAKLHAG